MTSKSAAAAARATVYGCPRQGADRELKRAVEGYWKGRVTAAGRRETAAGLRRANWLRLVDDGIHEVPTGDFSYYDHVLDTSVMVGAVPTRHRDTVEADGLDGYFAMARGTQDVAPLEMTKWFDTSDGRRQLGPAAARLAMAAVHSTDVADVAPELLRVLVQQTRETVSLGVLSGDEMVFIYRERGPQSVSVNAEL